MSASFKMIHIVRATIVSLPGSGVAKLFYVDQGWTAVARTECLFVLEERFSLEPEQVVTVTTTQPICPDLGSMAAVRQAAKDNQDLGWLVQEGGRVELLLDISTISANIVYKASPTPGSTLNHAMKTIALNKVVKMLSG